MSARSRIIDVRASILKDNEEGAETLRGGLAKLGVFLVNVMGSPGSGKTSLLTALLPLLAPPLRPAVIEADLDSRVDADALEARGWRAVQLRTGGFCHLDAFMVRRGLAELGVLPDRTSPPMIASSWKTSATSSAPPRSIRGPIWTWRCSRSPRGMTNRSSTP